METTSDTSSEQYHPADHLELTEEEFLEQEKEISLIQEQLEIETKIKKGAEMMLNLDKVPSEEISQQLKISEAKISGLNRQLHELKNSPAAVRRTLKIKRHKQLNMGPTRGESMGRIVAPELKKNQSSAKIKTEPPPDYTSSFDEILTNLAKPNNTPQLKIESLSKLSLLLKNPMKVEDYKSYAEIISKLRPFLLDTIKEVRASTYRALRHLIREMKAITVLLEHGIDFLIARSLVRDPRMEQEREQALKLIRSFLNIQDGANYIPRSVISAIVSIADTPDDKMQSICLETLCEISLYNIELVAHCAGLKSIFTSLATTNPDQTNSVILTLLHLIDREETRQYIRPEVDLEVILAAFTDANNRGPSCEEVTLIASAQAVVSLLKTWTGIIYLCSFNKASIKSLVDALALPYEEIRKQMLDIFFEIFRVKTPMWSADFNSALRRTLDSFVLDGRANPLDPNNRMQGRPDLVNNYLSVLLIAFFDANLIESLIEIMKDSNKHLAVRATILLGEVLNLANKLLPLSVARKFLTLPKLFQLGASFEDELLRNSATSAISHLEKIQRAKDNNHGIHFNSKLLSPNLSSPFLLNILNNSPGGNNRQQRIHAHARMAKIKGSMQVELDQFQNLLRDSLVMSEKNFEKWNWDVIYELAEGPFLNPKRFEEAINSKWLKKLFTFYHPTSRQFCDCKKGQPNEQYVRVGIQLIEAIVSHSDGIKFLAENDFLPQIASCLEELDPMIGSQKTEEPIFSAERMSNTLTSEYFSMIGVLTSLPEGILLLKRFRIFTLYYYLSELKSRDDIIKSIISSMDYRLGGHPRIILSKVMSSSSKNVRLFATDYLRMLYRAGLPNFADWAIRLLHTQVYDPVFEVCEKALIVLEEACCDEVNLVALVKLRPSFDHLGDVGNPMILKLLSSPAGFKYLNESNFVQEEMERWKGGLCEHYVQQIEYSLSRFLSPLVNTQPLVLSTTNKENKDNQTQSTTGNSSTIPVSLIFHSLSDIRETDGTVPPHLYSQLALTETGCNLLVHSGHLKDFVQIIKDFDSVPKKRTDVETKGALWSVGHIGSTPLGLPLLVEADAIKDIVKIAETSTTLSIRGTAFYALGLISKTNPGVELLEEFGWHSIYKSRDASEWSKESQGFVVPVDTTRMFQIPPPPQFKGSFPLSKSDLDPKEIADIPYPDQIAQDIVTSVGNLSNHIVATSASKQLSKLKQENAVYFTYPELYIDVMEVVSNYHFKLNAHRFVHELFDKVVLTDEAFRLIKRPGRKFGTGSSRQLTSLSEEPSSKSSDEQEQKQSKIDPKNDSKRQTLVPKVIINGFIVAK